MELGDWLKARGITQDAFAEMIGRNRWTVGAVVNHATMPNAATCTAIERVTDHEVTRVDLAKVAYARAWPGKESA